MCQNQFYTLKKNFNHKYFMPKYYESKFNLLISNKYEKLRELLIYTSLLIVSIRYLIMTLSKSSPPNLVSPFVDFTSKTPSFISRIEISKVPPPRSYTAILN